MYKILIVEDDTVIADAMKNSIMTWGFEAACAENFENVMAEFTEYGPHLVLLDISLPFFNGYHWCLEIRKVSKVPIIFISSMSENMNIVMAMNMGADDFIIKPFDLNVLIAKVQAMLRRTYDFVSDRNLIEHKGAILNLSDSTLTFQGKNIELTKNEFRILQLLMENKDKIISRDAIMIRLWEGDSFVDDNTLTVNMTRLRKKLETAGLNHFIITKKGMGYYI